MMVIREDGMFDVNDLPIEEQVEARKSLSTFVNSALDDDYTESTIEKQVEIFFRDLKKFVLEEIYVMPLTDKDVEEGIPKICKKKILDIFQMDEDLNY